MKILAFMGSPRLGGNSDMMVDKAIEGAKSKGAEVEKINLVDYQNEVCIACGKCREAGACVTWEKTNDLLQKMMVSDAFIFGTPTWWMAMSSLLKIYTDHFGAFLKMDYSSRIDGKSAIVLSSSGSPQTNMAEEVCKQVSQMLGFLKVDVKGTLGVNGLTEKGDVANNKEAMDKSFELGVKLVG